MPKKTNRNPGISKRGEKWQARAFFDGREVSKTFRTQDEAIRWKREQERALERGEWIDPSLSKITFAEWSDSWLRAKTNLSGRTVRGYKARINSHIIPRFGSFKLTSITNNQIGQWVADSIQNGVGQIALKQSVGILKQILDAAVLDGRISRNPVIGIRVPRVRAKEKKALNFDELKKLAAECGEFELLVLFAGTTGLRFSEIAALKVGDISVLQRNVRVDKAMSLGVNGEQIEKGTKTNQIRTVPIVKELIPSLIEITSTRFSDAPLFEMPLGGRLEYNNFMTRVFRPAVKRLNLEGISFHNLRHTTASLLISAGTPITAVSGILGHASTQMTLDVYGHLYEDEAAIYVDRLGEALFSSRTDKERTNVYSAIERISS